MTNARRFRLAALGACLLAAGCARTPAPTLGALCAGRSATARIVATVERVRGPGGPALVALIGTRFDLRLSFDPSPASAAGTDASNDCDSNGGSATFSGALPDPIRHAGSADGRASWRAEGDSLLLDLNPNVRDSNVFLTIPVHGGRGHWGLSTFAGEVAGGPVDVAP